MVFAVSAVKKNIREKMTELSTQTEELLREQLSSWELARSNYELLDKVLVKELCFDGFSVFVQFNPGRIVSTAAKVDKKSIGERPCFLCPANRPAEQDGVNAGNDLVVLVNPFPIFRKHLTIPSLNHTDQQISGNFSEMLRLARELQEYVIFYNGPQCGASAPDHLHFQAGNRGFIPVEKDFENLNNSVQVRENDGIKYRLWKNYLRGIITLTGSSGAGLALAFEEFLGKFSMIQPDRPEPMINILTCFSGDKWTIHLIPRRQHRPEQYFASDERKIIVSPASVDIGGVIITPRKEDFERLDEELVSDIFSQVCYSEKEVEQFI